MALYGLDLSHYQATDTVRQAKDFVILKATEGFNQPGSPGYVDPDCDNKYQLAKSLNLLRGVYGYTMQIDAVAESSFFVDNIQGYLGEAILVWDNETNTNVQFALDALNNIYALTKVRALLYMSADTATAVDWSPVYKAGYALYVAGYPAAFESANPALPAANGSDMTYNTGAWPFATIWQYSDSNGTLDRDIAYMTPEAWAKFAQGDREATPSPTTTSAAPAPTTTTTTTAQSTVSTPAATTSEPETTPATNNTPSLPTPSSETTTVTKQTISTPVPVSNEITVVTTKSENLFKSFVNFLKGKKTYLVGLIMVLTSLEKYLTGATTFSEFIVTVSGLVGVNGVSLVTIRAAIAKIEAKL